MTASLAHFQLLRRLRQLLRHQADNACLVYLWSDQPLANRWLQAELDAHVVTLQAAMKAAAGNLDFEKAASLRDEIKRLRTPESGLTWQARRA